MEHRKRKVQLGFSLVELVITLAIMAILLRIASPSYATWIMNQEIRAGAESIINAANLAKLEAMKRNGRVMFQLSDDVGQSTSWRICPVARGTIVCDATLPVIQERDSADESSHAQVGVSTNTATIIPGAMAVALAVGGVTSPSVTPTGIIFDGLGRPSTVGGFANMVRVDVRNLGTNAADERRLVIVFSGTGSARACDPRAVGNARAC
jgi:type IV fimbrial biogenesis protein FimT